MGMDAGDVCIFWPHVRLLFCNGGISEAARLAWSGTGGPGTLGHGHARRPDVNFVHEGGREGAAGPVAGHGQGWLGTATALHTRSLVMTDYDYDQWYNVLVLPACQGCGADITADPSRRSLDATAPTPNLPRFVFGENGTQQGGGRLLVVGFLQSGGLHSRFLSYFPDAQREGASVSRIPLLRTGTTIRRNKGKHEKGALTSAAKAARPLGSADQGQFCRGQRPSMPASYLLSARQVLRIRVLSIWYQVVLQRQAFFPARHKKEKQNPPRQKWQNAKNPGIPVRESCV